MGVDFYVYWKEGTRKSLAKRPLPKIEAHFAFTEYPRFLAKLAEDAGLGDRWRAMQNASSRLVDKILEPLMSEQKGLCGRMETPKTKPKKRRGESCGPTSQATGEIERLKEGIEETRQKLAGLTSQQPLIEFLLTPQDSGTLDSAACVRIAPVLKQIAERWEPAPEGCVGWREKALEIAAAMEIAGEDPNVEFMVSG